MPGEHSQAHDHSHALQAQDVTWLTEGSIDDPDLARNYCW
jgi:hypothetical protein